MKNIEHISKLFSDNDYLKSTLSRLDIELYELGNGVRPPDKPKLAIKAVNNYLILFDKKSIETMISLIFPYEESRISIKNILSAVNLFNFIFNRHATRVISESIIIRCYSDYLYITIYNFSLRYNIKENKSSISLRNSEFTNFNLTLDGFGFEVFYQLILNDFKYAFSIYNNLNTISINNKLVNKCYQFILNSLKYLFPVYYKKNDITITDKFINNMVTVTSFDYFNRNFKNGNFNIIDNQQFINNISMSNIVKLYGKNDKTINKKNSNTILYFKVDEYQYDLKNTRVSNFDFINKERSTNILTSPTNIKGIKTLLKGILNNEELSYFLSIFSLISFFDENIGFSENTYKDSDSSLFSFNKLNFIPGNYNKNSDFYKIYCSGFSLTMNDSHVLEFNHSAIKLVCDDKIIHMPTSTSINKISNTSTFKEMYNDLSIVIINYISKQLSISGEKIKNEHIQILQMINS